MRDEARRLLARQPWNRLLLLGLALHERLVALALGQPPPPRIVSNLSKQKELENAGYTTLVVNLPALGLALAPLRAGGARAGGARRLGPHELPEDVGLRQQKLDALLGEPRLLELNRLGLRAGGLAAALARLAVGRPVATSNLSAKT